MLDQSALKENIENGIRTLVCPAIKECLLRSYPIQSIVGDLMAENFSNNFDKMVSEQLAEVIASAIDYYVKNIEIFGTVITVGGPTTQTAQINSTPTPMINGAIPNTFGIR